MNKSVGDVFLKRVSVQRGSKTTFVPKLLALIEQKLNEAFDDPTGRLLVQILRLAREFGVLHRVEEREFDLRDRS